VQSRMAVFLCDLEMMSYPHTVLFKRLAAHHHSPVRRQARGRGSTQASDAVKRRLCKSQSEYPINARGSGIWGLGELPRSKTQPLWAFCPSCGGSSLSCRVRRRAYSLCSFRYAEIAPDQRRFDVLACNTPHERVCARAYSTLCLSHASSPVVPDIFVRARSREEKESPLQKRPI
jgi:hypothetical protein